MAHWPLAWRAPLSMLQLPALQGCQSQQWWSRAGQPMPPPAAGLSRALRRRRSPSVLPRYPLPLLSKTISQVSCVSWWILGGIHIFLFFSMLYIKFLLIVTFNITCGLPQGDVSIKGFKTRPHTDGELYQKWNHKLSCFDGCITFILPPNWFLLGHAFRSV